MPEPPFTPATDAHIHVMPPRLISAIRDALTAEAGWDFPHPRQPDRIERRLFEAGVDRYIALPYAHKPDVAADLNEWLLEWAADSAAAIPFATVHGDDDVETVVREAFEAGARGLKFQCPVQKAGPADPRLDPAFELAAEYDRPIMFHAGNAPMFEGSPHVGADQFADFIASFPDVRACAAHMGAYEAEEFVAFAREHDQIFLDTTMALSPKSEEFLGFDAGTIANETVIELSESIMYGSDFPNVPYAYRWERRGLLDRQLPEDVYDDLFRRTADRFLDG